MPGVERQSSLQGCFLVVLACESHLTFCSGFNMISCIFQRSVLC